MKAGARCNPTIHCMTTPAENRVESLARGYKIKNRSSSAIVSVGGNFRRVCSMGLAMPMIEISSEMNDETRDF